jgi:ribosomal protein S12 methylthiotransferase accessory factor
MDIGVVGSGPAVEAVVAAASDVDATVSETAPETLGTYDLSVVVAPAGADVFGLADEHASRLVSVEVGGVGGHPQAALDASVGVFTPESARYTDLRARVASTGGASADGPSGDRSAVRLAGAIAGHRAVRTLAGDDLGGTVVEVPGPERRVLPVPQPTASDRSLRRDHRDVELTDALDRAERALDDRVGLVTEVGEQESFPAPYYIARTADTSVFSDVRAAEFAAGVDPGWDAAFMKALGEALERYSAGVYRASAFTTAPAANVSRAVPPASFVTPDDRRLPGPDEPVQWVDGEQLATGESASLPAALVQYPPPDDQFTPPITTGLGLGNSGVEATLSGLYEVLERDATMLAWYSTFEPLGLTVEDDGFETLVGRARSERLTVTPLLVTQDVDVPVVAVAVHREPDWPRFAVGSSANLDAAAAARSALAEALQNWMELRSMGTEAADQQAGAIGRYADFPREARQLVDVDGRVPASSVGPETRVTGTDELDAVVDRVAAAGLEPYAVRLTPRDIEALGFEAVRALVPAAQPLFTGEPFFGDRARTVPRELGFQPRLDRTYHPYP